MEDDRFEWDEDKNRSNAAKHGVRFEFARKIFEGPVLASADDREDYGELREISLGMVGAVTVIVVTHVDRNGRMRIISARHANRAERRRYEQIFR